MKKIAICALIIMFSAADAHAGPAAQIQYVHDYIVAKTGIDVPIKTANTTAPAYVKYLLATIDRANALSAGSTATDYQNHALATQIAIPVENVWDAASRLFNCKAGGAYKTGAISATNGTGNIACEVCTQNYYCPSGSNDRISCNAGFGTNDTGKTAATDCARACATTDISGSYAVSGNVNQTQTPSSACVLTSCAARYYKNGNVCTYCATGCSTSQSCTPTGCTVSNGTCVYATNGGTQTRSAACTNAAGNAAGLTCAAWGACSTSGVAKTVSCNSWYTAQNQGTASASCVAAPISSATPPTSCSSITSGADDSEATISGCTGGSAGGAAVSSFVVGGYCSSHQGSGPPPPSPAAGGGGKYCSCRIHSINGTAVVLSSLFAGVYTFGSGPYCRINCLNTCASKAKDDSNIRSGLFSVIGS